MSEADPKLFKFSRRGAPIVALKSIKFQLTIKGILEKCTGYHGASDRLKKEQKTGYDVQNLTAFYGS